MRVVIVVIDIDADPVTEAIRAGVKMNFKEVGVNLARERVVRVIGVRVDVLKRRQEKGEQQSQNRLDRRRSTHH